MSVWAGEVDKFQVGDLTVKIEYDPEPLNPRKEYDNLGIMVCFHRRYNLGDETDYRSEDYHSWDELREAIEKNEDPVVILPLYLHDHSGLTMRTSDFGDHWDSGQVGFIYLPREKAKKEYGKLTKKNLKNAKEVLEGEVDTYDEYLGGQVYGFVIEDENEEEIESLWGIFGLNYAKQEAREQAEALAKRKSGSSMGRPRMKIKQEDFEDLQRAISAIPDLEATWRDYKKRGLSAMRFRWDMLWKSGFKTNRLYDYLNDENIDTALKSILPFAED